MQHNIPERYRAASFPKPGAQQLEIREVEIKKARENEILIRVHATALNSTDQIIRNDLVPGIRFPSTPGGSVVGTVVDVGKRDSAALGPKFEKGDKVAGAKFMNGLAEYARVHVESAVEIKKGQLEGQAEEAAVLALDGGRVYGSYLRSVRQWEKGYDEAERRQLVEINKRIGFGKQGVFVVYGQGGYARLALEVLEKAQKERKNTVSSPGGIMSSLFGNKGEEQERIILIATSEKWSAKDYGLSDRDVLYEGRSNIAEELKRLGGANLVICVDQPRKDFTNVLDGVRFGADVSILNPSEDAKLNLPLANVLAKALRIQGPPILTHEVLHSTLSLVEKHKIRAPTKTYRFDEREVNEAFKSLEEGHQFEAPLVVFSHQQ